MYYLRSRPAADPIKFTVDKSRLAAAIKIDEAMEKENDKLDDAAKREELNIARGVKQCNMTDENGACLMCSS